MSTGATKNDQAIDEAQIRQLADNWAKAICAKDINALMSHYTPDILVFDLAPPLQYVGIDAYRKNFEEWFSSFQSPIGYEIRDLSISPGDDVAFGHHLERDPEFLIELPKEVQVLDIVASHGRTGGS